MTTATGDFAVTGMTEETYLERENGKLTRAGGTQQFTGEFEGTGSVDWLMCYRDGGADFVGMQLVEGTLAGRRGSFVLSATGAYEGTTSTMRLEIVAGSGTGQLAGISGSAEFVAGPGPQGHYTLDYRLR